jgi:hypothetical protein
MKKLLTWIVTILVVVSFSVSCKKFIKEDLVSTLTYDYYKTDAGLEDLVRSGYAPLRYKFDNEQSYSLWNYGIDEVILGDQFNYSYYNTYDARLNGADGFLNGVWSTFYDGINRCNLGIELITAFNDPASRILGTETQKKQRLGELYFLRGFYYFQLVQQFGGVPLVLTTSATARTDFPRQTVPKVYEQIISDLRYASENTAPSNSEQGRVRKGAADHFLAKAYLTRGSAVTEQRGQKATDMDSAAYFAEQVIAATGVYTLEADYMNLWQVAYPKGYPNVAVNIGSPGPPVVQGAVPYNTDGASGVPSGESSKLAAGNASREIVFAAQFSGNLGLASPPGSTAGGNRTHEYFICQYDGGIPGLIRGADNFNGRPFRRMGPSDYSIDLFDRKNDSRFYKSFRTVFYANTVAAGAPRVGDTAAFFIVNNKGTTMDSVRLSQYRYKAYARYFKNTAGVEVRGFDNNKYLSLVKHNDPVRVLPGFNEERGVRVGIIARLAETYLIAAEAWGRKGDYTKALQYINALRTRAAYKAGEFKNPAVWMFDGGPNDASATTAAMQATATLWTTNALSEQYPPFVTSDADRFIHFILNERTRELFGEFLRWEDLVRTETLVSRTKLYNRDATSLQAFHKLRPIPSQQIDITTINGQPMTAAEKAAYQNPGY